MSIGILGGGLSGISLQHLLKGESEVLEKEDRIGGLCRTFHKDGFCYDIGGHILFSKDKEITNFVKKVLAHNINYCRRNNKIFFKGRYVKYPFENGFGALDKEDVYRCLIGYLKNDNPKPSNFLEWLYYAFGNGLAEKYLIPYNRKIWKTSLKNISLEWVERVPKPPLEDVVKSALGIETEGYIHQLYFNYPASGGIEGLIKALANPTAKSLSRARIITDFEVKKIEKRGPKWCVSNGASIKYYDKLVITLPIKEAVKYMRDVPLNVLNAASALRYNSVRVVLIGINNESVLDKSAIYIPSSDIIPHRLCYMGYFSKNNVPKGKSSLIAEITTHRSHELYHISDIKLIKKVVEDLDKTGIIHKKDIIVTDAKFFEYGYVVYDLKYQKNIRIIRDYFRDIGIELHGRFAEFEYINMDEVIRRSMELSKRLNRQL